MTLRDNMTLQVTMHSGWGSTMGDYTHSLNTGLIPGTAMGPGIVGPLTVTTAVLLVGTTPLGINPVFSYE